MRIFETIKPGHQLLQKYISYYYLDRADEQDYCNEYICYPHYNNTISLYQSHTASLQNHHSIVNFDKYAPPLQIFTPLRENTLKVTQKGPVYKIGIVFEPLGIHQFLREEIAINERACSPTFHFLRMLLYRRCSNQVNWRKLPACSISNSYNYSRQRKMLTSAKPSKCWMP